MIVSDPSRPVWEYESVHVPPKLIDLSAAVTDRAEAASVTVEESTAATGPVFPAVSDTPFCARRSWSVPSWHWVTTTLTLLPLAADGVNTHPTAVPAFVKSAAAIPETDSEKVMPNVNDTAAAGDDGVEVTEAVGGSMSMFMVVEFGAGGPCIADTAPVTAFVATVTMRVPVETADEESDSTYGPAPLPERATIDIPCSCP